MRTAITGILSAIVLFAGAMLCWTEAARVREVADAHRRLVTLRYESPDGLGGGEAPRGRLVAWLDRWAGGTGDRRATVSYWLADYETVARASASTTGAPVDGRLLFIAANGLFRTSRPAEGDRKLAVARLDEVVQAYARVLREDGANQDAAFNYEYVARLRDVTARARPNTRDRRAGAPQESLESASFDLPPGPTIHGRPGGPPAEVPMGEFKATTPMRYDEREEMPEPTAGSRLRRRG